MRRFRALSPLLASVALAIGPTSFRSAVAAAEVANAPEQDVLSAERDGLAEVRFIPDDSRSARVVVRNLADRPLTLRLPPAFAGVPVLAQINPGGFAGAGIGAVPQNVGGGGVQNAGMGIGGAPGAGFGGGFCWVAREVYGVHDPRWLAFRQWMIWRAPTGLQDLYRAHGEDFAVWLHERPVAKAAVRLAMDRVVGSADAESAGGLFRVVTAPADAFARPFAVPAGQSLMLRVPTVCLQYGRREPMPQIPYRLEPLANVSQDPKAALILGGLASGHLSQKVAQAAAWHVCSGRTWEQLAAEVIDQAGGDPDVPVFTGAELAAARRAVEIATRLAAEAPAPRHSSAETSAR